jgi:integrase
MSRSYRKLTRDAVKKMRSGDRIAEAGIIAARGIDGDVRWSVNVMVSGRRIHRVVGRDSEGVSRSDCEAFIERARTEERDGRLHLPTGRKTWLSFQQLAERYLDRQEASGGRNIKVKRRQMESHLIPAFGPQRGDTLTEFSVNTYKRKRTIAGAAAGTVNRELATLKHFLRDAVKAKDLRTLPCSFALLPEPQSRITVLSEEQASALITAAIGDQNPDIWLFVAFGLNTAMRHAEILRARWDEIDWERGRLHIGKAKAGAREQPLTPALVAMLKKERAQRTDSRGFIFAAHSTGKDPTGHRARLTRPFARAAKRAGLETKLVTPHVMRHTAITRLVQAGVDLPTIQRISGHKTLSMVLRYAHVSGSHIDAAMTALDRTLPEPAAESENVASTLVTPKLHTGTV